MATNVYEYLTKAKNSQNKADGLIDSNFGEQGYKKGLSLAQEAAANQTQSASNQAMKAARSAGASKSKAAMLGANSATDAYSQNLTNQQNVANAQLQGQQAAAQNSASNWANIGSSAYQNQDTVSKLTGGQGLIGGLGTILFSDENLKDVQVEDTLNNFKTWWRKYKCR